MQKVLIIEDDPTMQLLLRTLLEMEGYKVVRLPEDEDLIEPIRDENPDLILMDVYLKHRNGLELLSEIKADVGLKHIYVVMSSGRDVSDLCLKAGADDFLLKPFMPEDLLTKIGTLIR